MKLQNTLIDALYGRRKVLRMSDAVPGWSRLTNLGITRPGWTAADILLSRSADSELQDAAQMLGSVWEPAGYQAGL
jgi:hypothetical protein